MTYVLFDCPDDKNDKAWLYDELSRKTGERGIQSVTIHHVVNDLYVKGGILRLYGYYILLLQAFRAIIKAGRNDTIICWSMVISLFFGGFATAFRRRYQHVVFMNWLTPIKSSKRLAVYRAIVKWLAPDIIVNSPQSISEWTQVLSMRPDKFHLIPDVYDSNIPFIGKAHKECDRYCFTGGIANRDWHLVMELANKMPDIKFVCAALKSDFSKKVETIPTNVLVYYDLSSDVYYSLMKKSYIILLPLIDSRASGLINILRAAQYRIPCAITRTEATQQYYSSKTKFLLLDYDIEHWALVIRKIYDMGLSEYDGVAEDFQNYIRTEFSPAKAAAKIAQIIT